MSFVTFVLLALALGVSFTPVWLLRRAAGARAQDHFVSSGHTRPEVIRNASIAYALRMAAFGPLFAWGASGDLRPAIIASVFFGLGVYLIYLLRQPLLEFLDDALRRDRSITVHAFIARQHGDDPRVRLLGASLTVVALLGLLAGEALGVAAFLEGMLPGHPASVYLFVFGVLLLSALHASLAGHSGVMHSAQLQLGLLYLGLFGSTALLLYLHVAALTPMPPHGGFAVAFVVACCATMLWYRRSKYVDTEPIRRPASDGQPGRASSGARMLARFEKILNPSVSTLIVLVIVFALMEFYAAGLPAIARDSAAALRTGTPSPGVGLLALCLLPLFYPLVDVTNWQRLAAARKDAVGDAVGRDGRSAALRGILGMYGLESVLVLLFFCMLGAIAVTAIETPAGADLLTAFVARLVAADNEVTVVILALLLICVSAIAISTMSALFSASLCTIRYDMLAALWPELAPGQAPASTEASARRRTLVAGGGLGLAAAVAFCIADAWLRVSFASGTFLALLFAFCCAQLALAPLVLGPIVGRARGRSGTVSPGWALAILGSGAASGVTAVIVYLATRSEPWLWAAVPACLGSGLALFAIARATSRDTI